MPSMKTRATDVFVYLPFSNVSIFTSGDFRYLLTRLRLDFMLSVKPFRGPLTASPVGGSEIALTSNFLRSTVMHFFFPSMKIAAFPPRISFVASEILSFVLTLASVIALERLAALFLGSLFASGAITSSPKSSLSVIESIYTQKAAVPPISKSKKITSSLPRMAFIAFLLYSISLFIFIFQVFLFLRLLCKIYKNVRFIFCERFYH